MDLGIISMRYAKALLKFAAEHKEEERVYAEMGNVTAAFAKVEALQHALLNPVLTDAQREQLLATAAGSEKDLTATTRRFIHLVVTKGRADIMQLIARSYGTLYRRERHIIEGSLTVRDVLSLKSACEVKGDLEIAKIAVELGSSFDGTCKMLRKQPVMIVIITSAFVIFFVISK